jgi:peptidoglycan/LPS O-acetylase OafA/YrhL
MLEVFFFILGLVNSVFLIVIFLIRKHGLNLVRRIGWIYLLLALPTIYGIILVAQEQKTVRYSIFLGIFLTFLFLELLLDFVFKINFRENWKQNWKWLVPYLGLYYMMNYGFVVMPWKTSSAWGLTMLGLFIIQIIVNLKSHPKMSG